VTQTDYLIILDTSGSMLAIKDQTIGNFNEQVQVIEKESKDQDARISLVLFNNPGDDKIVLWRKPVSEIKPLTAEDYVPTGTTALYDSICTHLDSLSKEVTDTPVLVVIITDGYENMSVSSKGDVVERIQRLKTTGRWTFVYMGANQNLEDISHDLKIPPQNVLAYHSDAKGTREGGIIMSAGIADYARSRGSSTTTFFRAKTKGSMADRS